MGAGGGRAFQQQQEGPGGAGGLSQGSRWPRSLSGWRVFRGNVNPSLPGLNAVLSKATEEPEAPGPLLAPGSDLNSRPEGERSQVVLTRDLAHQAAERPHPHPRPNPASSAVSGDTELVGGSPCYLRFQICPPCQDDSLSW